MTAPIPILSSGVPCMQSVHGQISQKVAMLAQEQLEEVVQELEDLRIKYDALKADNSTLLAERKGDSAGSPGAGAAAEANGDAGAHRVLGAAEHAAVYPLGMAQLEVCPTSSVWSRCSTML